MNFVKVKTLLLGTLLIASSLFADPVNFSLKSEVETVKAGEPFLVALDFSMEKGWHAYWKNPGDAGMPPKVEWILPEGFEVTALYWPLPTKFSVGPLEANGYSDKAVLIAEITPSKTVAQTEHKLKAEATWVVCNDESCLPGSGESEITLKVASVAGERLHTGYFEEAKAKIPTAHPAVSLKKEGGAHKAAVKIDTVSNESLKNADFFPVSGKVSVKAEAHPTDVGHVLLSFEGKDIPEGGIFFLFDKAVEVSFSKDNDIAFLDEMAEAPHLELDSLWVALLFAFLGGMILNLMPCVLPVVAIKILDFVKLAGQKRIETLKHGLAFAGGVLVSFWALAGVLLVLQSLGESVGWGFQLQEPAFVAALAILMVFFAMSLFGVFEMGVLVASWAGQKEVNHKQKKAKSSMVAAFFSGALATAVATPCTGPFLGSAIGYAVTLPPFKSLMIFTSLGLGMALPYLLLTAFPRLLKFVPKPGKWMETFRQAMGFMMLMAALWLTWVFAGQTQDPATMMLLAVFVAIGLIAWILGKWATPFSSKKARIISWSMALVLAIASVKTVRFASSLSGRPMTEEIAEGDWEPFSPTRLAELKAQGTPVFVDFTAKWCLTCQFNHMALSTKPVEAKFKDKGVVKMKADWTQKSPEITAEMKKFGRNSVPLYVLYEKEDSQILPQTLTPELVISTLEQNVK